MFLFRFVEIDEWNITQIKNAVAGPTIADSLKRFWR